MAGKFEIYQDKAGEYRFRLKAGNGENILASEGYKQKSGCENGIASVQKNAADEGRFETKTSTNGKPYFVLKGGQSRDHRQVRNVRVRSGLQKRHSVGDE